MAVDSGAQGIIVPGTQLDMVKDLEVPKLCPAIRPTWYEDKKANDQEQPVTPEEAAKGGARYLVVGSPVTKSENPVQALERILQETDAVQ
jgi:orotidine-5'-phosphate decarboxylase